MNQLVTTRLLVCNPETGTVWHRGYSLINGLWFPFGEFLGNVWTGPEVFIDDLDIIEQWQWLQELLASTARK